MTRAVLISLIIIIYLVYAAFKYKDTWKKLRLGQLAGVFLTFIGIISIAGVILFYGSRYITTVVTGDISAFILQFIAALIMIAASGFAFVAIASRITNGVIPIERQQGNDQTTREHTKRKS